MKNLIEGLRDLWNEYERRLRMLQYNEDGVTRARKRIHDLSLFMIQKKYDVYSDSVGEEFLAEIKKTVTRKRAVSDYRVTISRINSCNTDAFWAEKFCIKNYEIKNKGLLALTDKLLEMLKVRGYKEEDSWRSRAEMTIECIKQLDIYMIENDILNYTCNVGNEFVETIRLVTDKNFRTYNDIYVLNIKRINLILSGSPAVLQSPKEYVIRNSAIRDGLSELLT